MLHTKMFNVRTRYTRIQAVFCPNLCYIQKCTMSEHMLHTKLWCLVSELMIHSKMCDIGTYVTHENIIRTNERMLHTKIWCLESALMSLIKICNVHSSWTFFGIASTFQNLNLGIASADDKWNPCIKSLLIVMCMKHVIKIFQKVQEIEPFSEFGPRQSLDKWHLTIPWATSCQSQCAC